MLKVSFKAIFSAHFANLVSKEYFSIQHLIIFLLYEQLISLDGQCCSRVLGILRGLKCFQHTNKHKKILNGKVLCMFHSIMERQGNSHTTSCNCYRINNMNQLSRIMLFRALIEGDMGIYGTELFFTWYFGNFDFNRRYMEYHLALQYTVFDPFG